MKYIIAYLICFLLFGCAERHKSNYTSDNVSFDTANTLIEVIDSADYSVYRYSPHPGVAGKTYLSRENVHSLPKPKKKDYIDMPATDCPYNAIYYIVVDSNCCSKGSQKPIAFLTHLPSSAIDMQKSKKKDRVVHQSYPSGFYYNNRVSIQRDSTWNRRLDSTRNKHKKIIFNFQDTTKWNSHGLSILDSIRCYRAGWELKNQEMKIIREEYFDNGIHIESHRLIYK